jgi:hypothetical protein
MYKVNTPTYDNFLSMTPENQAQAIQALLSEARLMLACFMPHLSPSQTLDAIDSLNAHIDLLATGPLLHK